MWTLLGNRRYPVKDRHHPGVHRRWVPVAAALAATSSCFGGDTLASCDPRPGDTPRKALDAFYDSCGDLRPEKVSGPYDGDKQSTRYASYADVAEFSIVRDRKTWFVLVGRQNESSPWRVLTAGGAENSGY